MKKKTTLDMAIEFFEGQVSSINEIEKLGTETKNEVYKIITNDKRVFILKLLNDDDSSIRNNEVLMYDKLKNSGFIRDSIKGSYYFDGKTNNLLIIEYIKGSTLLELVQSDNQQAFKAVENVADYIRFCSDMSVSGYGNLKKNFVGEHSSWLEVLNEYTDKIKIKINNLNMSCSKKYMLRIVSDIEKFLSENKSYFINVKAALIPIDLNLTNFLVSARDDFFVLDIDAFWAGDFLLAIGEFIGHIYGSKYYRGFIEKFSFTAYEQKIVHFYALMCNLDVLLYIADIDETNLKRQKPYGNDITFFDLYLSHRNVIDCDVDWDITSSLLNNRFNTNDWGVKINLNSDRTVSPKVTLDRIEKVKHIAGITRVAEITGLDSVGVYAYQSVRPAAEEADDTFTVFSGKGSSKIQCKVSAIVEGIERYCGEIGNYDKTKILFE